MQESISSLPHYSVGNTNERDNLHNSIMCLDITDYLHNCIMPPIREKALNISRYEHTELYKVHISTNNQSLLFFVTCIPVERN